MSEFSLWLHNDAPVQILNTVQNKVKSWMGIVLFLERNVEKSAKSEQK